MALYAQFFRLWGFFLLCCLPAVAPGQSFEEAPPLPPNDFFAWVVRHHPEAVAAGLLANRAEAAERMARGGFDPKLYADYEQKRFDGNEYFSVGEAGVKVPTWLGVEIKGSYQIVDGIYLNPERNLPANGQAGIGLEVSLLRGLVIDERRGALRQAELLAAGNMAERRRRINDLLREAGEVYWDWTVAYNQLQVQEQALAIARDRLGALVSSYQQGDTPAVDTLETFLQVQTREFDRNEALVVMRNAAMDLSNFLWLEGQTPLMLNDSLRPYAWDELNRPLDLAPMEGYLDRLNARHPILQQYRVQQQQLEVDRRLAAEQLKPRLDVSYYLLGDGWSFTGDQNGETGLGNWLQENYKWGLAFEFPLFLRKERGKLQLTQIKQSEVELKLREKRQELATKIIAYYNQLENLQQQIALSRDMVANYDRLLQAENRLFQIGESSIFLINSREQKLLEAQLKLAELEGKWEKARLKLEWAAGRLE